MCQTIHRRIFLIALLMLPSAIAVSADNASATNVIASVLIELNHFPSEGEKEALLAIANDDGVGRAFRAVANAVANIEHSATAADKEIMNRIIASERAHANAKVFAEILLELNHTASVDAQAKLQELL